MFLPSFNPYGIIGGVVQHSAHRWRFLVNQANKFERRVKPAMTEAAVIHQAAALQEISHYVRDDGLQLPIIQDMN